MPRPLRTTGSKTCTGCGVEKDISDFYLRGGSHSPNSRKSKCKECDKARLKKNHDPERYRHNDLKRRYGITLEEHNKMFDEQNGVCYLCNKPGDGRWKNLCVDHDHKTGKVRKLLCRSCNTALGQVEDNISLLESMVDYLKEHK